MTNSSVDQASRDEQSNDEPGREPSRNGRIPDADITAILAEADLAKRRRWPLLVVGALVGGLAAILAMSYFDRAENQEAVETEVFDLAVAEVTRQDLLEEIDWVGTLGYGEPVTLVGSGGIITSAATQGAAVGRGDVLATVDSGPVVALYGDTPFWRTMADGTEGRDVFQLEANLAALGYDPDQTVDIDETFTSNTELMVERWQESLGVEATGVVDVQSVVATEGPSYVVSVGAVGSAVSGSFATLTPRQAVTDLVAPVDGVVSDVLAVGSPIDDGAVLYRVDDVTVIAQVGTVPVDDDDVHYNVVPDGSVVETVMVEDGTEVVTGGPILTAAASTLSVGVEVDVAEADEFELGQQVTIELADETIVPGVVETISSVIPAANPQTSPTVEISIVAEVGIGSDLVEGPVTVRSIGQLIEDATVIPTRALIALAEGGFAVEKVEADGSGSLIAIELGAFDDGVVEITSDGLAPGDEVVVPQ